MRVSFGRGGHRCTLALAVVLAAGLFGTGLASEHRVLVLVSHSAPPYEQALGGFQQALRQQRLEAILDVQPLGGDAARAARALQEAKRVRARAVLALGTLAMQAATEPGVDMPVVAGLVLGVGELRRTPNVTGVALDLPPEVQLQWLRRFLPSAQTVGVLYNPAENGQRVAAASRVASGMGLKLDAQEVGAPRDLPAALESIGKRVDVLWGLSDSVVLTPETAKQVLLFSFRARIPLIGPSPTWARAGALYALDWDYQDLGAQCGEMMARVLQGASPSGIPVTTPRKVLYVVNQRTAQQMKLELPEALLRNARELY